MGGEGRDGDWECGGCRNRNYAFRSICNRCKQPRLLVDTKTPADSKWLPRIGDWICSGCSNNNYASREKCKKCGQPKDEAAMPAIGMSGASFPTYANYFARVQGLLGLRMNYGMMGSALQHSLPPFPNWPYAGANKYELQSGPNWTLSGNTSKFSYGHNANQLLEVPKGWRSGDWICNCGFHNYSSRTECKKCNAPLPSGASSSVARSTTSDFFPTLGTKRLASEEFVNDWDNKRLNAGDFNSHFLENSQIRSYQSFEQLTGSSSNEITGTYSRFSGGGSSTTSNIRMHAHSPQQKIMPTLLGKGAKQWRDGDWMCTNCNNHNFASRSCCNRCKTQREASSQTVNVA